METNKRVGPVNYSNQAVVGLKETNKKYKPGSTVKGEANGANYEKIHAPKYYEENKKEIIKIKVKYKGEEKTIKQLLDDKYFTDADIIDALTCSFIEPNKESKNKHKKIETRLPTLNDVKSQLQAKYTTRKGYDDAIGDVFKAFNKALGEKK